VPKLTAEVDDGGLTGAPGITGDLRGERVGDSDIYIQTQYFFSLW
jgi:hypothetical protein